MIAQKAPDRDRSNSAVGFFGLLIGIEERQFGAVGLRKRLCPAPSKPALHCTMAIIYPDAVL
jgi:hypothetical protein